MKKNRMKCQLCYIGLTVPAAAKLIGVPYGTLAGYLNNISPMPKTVKKKIENLIVEKYKSSKKEV